MIAAIIDMYSDEPAGLGVPPYLGTYPRYLAGALIEQGFQVFYLTIDDIRYFYKYNQQVKEVKISQKTDIKISHLTKNADNVSEILENSNEIIVVGGAHTSGKYLSAVPGNLNEITPIIGSLKAKKILAGPLASEFGSSYQGGRHLRHYSHDAFDQIQYLPKSIGDYSKINPVKGAGIVNQIRWPVIAEIETGSGCPREKGCSFCTEPLKGRPVFREPSDIIAEAKELCRHGVTRFRLGKQSCFYSYKNCDVARIEEILKSISGLNPDTLHIDNANPALVVTEKGRQITDLIVKYCTSGNVAAFGVESFDPKVLQANNLNSDLETTLAAIKELNEKGGHKGKDGLPIFLPGVNILLGLINENRETLQANFDTLKYIYEQGWMLRRINIRQVIPYHSTELHNVAGDKFIKKNKKYYYSFRKKIREQIDNPMLRRLAPTGTVLRNVYTEVWDGKTTFARQFGTYPLIIGIKERLPLGRFYNVKVTGYMLRSIIGEITDEK